MGRKALVTGASSGIGAATVRRLVADGWDVVGVARRADRLEALGRETGAEMITADLTDDADVARLRDALSGGGLGALVNVAGGAIGTESVELGDVADWQRMFEINVLTTKRLIGAMLPLLRDGIPAGGTSSIVTITSTAGHDVYEGGGGYNAAKFAQVALVGALRLELAGEPIRVIEIAPGLVKTDEFALVRYRGDSERAAAVYDNVPNPLTADDVADAIGYTLGAPSHVNVDRMVLRPVAQAAAHKLIRGELKPAEQPH